MIKAMNHVGVSVSNLERAIEFYRDAFGMEIVLQRSFGSELDEAILALKGARGRIATVGLGDTQIELFEFASPRPKPADPNRPVCDHGITHFCLQVTDLHGKYERLKAAGVVFHCPPLDFSGEVSAKIFATYGRDPDGNVFELIEIIEG